MVNLLTSFLGGILALATVILVGILFVWCIVQYKKTGASTFSNGVLFTATIALGWTGVVLSFITLLLNNGVHYESHFVFLNILSFSTIPLGTYGTSNVAFNLAGGMKGKKLYHASFITLIVIYEVCLVFAIMDFNAGGTGLISDIHFKGQVYKSVVNFGTPLYFMIFVVVGYALLFGLLGLIRFLKQTAGDLRKRAFYIIIGSVLIVFGILGDTVILGNWPFTPIDNFIDLVWIPRASVVASAFFWYMGFRTMK